MHCEQTMLPNKYDFHYNNNNNNNNKHICIAPYGRNLRGAYISPISTNVPDDGLHAPNSPQLYKSHRHNQLYGDRLRGIDCVGGQNVLKQTRRLFVATAVENV